MNPRALPIGLFLISSLLTSTVYSQACGEGRYQLEQFSEVAVQSGIEFGSNTAVSGGAQTLRMDVYTPVGDVVEERAVILVAFGGSFIGGTRADVADLCTSFAKMGYVAIAPDYRVGFFFPNTTTTTLAVLRGAHDMKACVRYLRKTVEEQDNPYGIDQDRIIIGGVSAGAISAIQATYLDQESEIPEALSGQIAALGGVEGNSGNPGYSSAVLGCFSMSGAIGDTSWVQAGDPPLVSVHDVGDEVVPYLTQEVAVIGIPTGLVASGSFDIHARFNSLGISNCLLPYPGNGHVAYLNSDPVGSVGFVATFCGELSCGLETTCNTLITSVGDLPEADPQLVFPNPTTGTIRIELNDPSIIEVVDMSGRKVLTTYGSEGSNGIDLSSLPDGVYMLWLGNRGSAPIRVIKAE